MEYDSQDRVAQEKTGDSIKTYAYDTCGRLAESSSEGSTIRYTYNKYGELSEKTYENGQKISYSYDQFGRKGSVTVKDGDRVLDRTTYAYDAMDRIMRVVAKDGTAAVYAYDENGNRSAATFASGVRITYEYDALNRLLVQKTVDKTGALIAQYQYTTGKNGERTKIQEEGPAGETETEYEYDGAGRLTGEHIVSADSTGNETHTAASSVVSIVLAIYSVSEGDYLNALVYGAVAVARIIGVCRWYRMSFKIDIIGSKGKISVADNKNYETQPQRLV